jgi:hypothetical protein
MIDTTELKERILILDEWAAADGRGDECVGYHKTLALIDDLEHPKARRRGQPIYGAPELSADLIDRLKSEGIM